MEIRNEKGRIVTNSPGGGEYPTCSAKKED
jgi:hypothetical protein